MKKHFFIYICTERSTGASVRANSNLAITRYHYTNFRAGQILVLQTADHRFNIYTQDIAVCCTVGPLPGIMSGETR